MVRVQWEKNAEKSVGKYNVVSGRKMGRNTAVLPLAVIRMIKTNGEIVVIS